MGAGGRDDSATGRRTPDEGDHQGGDYVGSNPETSRARTPSPGRGASRDFDDGAQTTNAALHDRQQGGANGSDPTHNMREINMLRAQNSPAHNPEQARNTERRDNHAGPTNTPDRGAAGNPQQRQPSQAQPNPQPPPPQPPPPLPGPNAPRRVAPRPVHREPDEFPGPTNPNAGKRVKMTKASVKLAALNMSGLGNVNFWHIDNKWFNLWRIIQDYKVGVLIIGEAHLNDSRHHDVESLFGRCLKVHFTEDPRSPNAAGLAFAVNKGLMKVENMKSVTVIPGRAMLLEIEWHGENPLSILGVYAPNAPEDNAQFWLDIKQWFVQHPGTRRPDTMGGDTNVVEDPVDRLPAHSDALAAVLALDELKRYFGMADGFRDTYPSVKAYTYHQKATGSQSRIDRINVKHGLLSQAYEWEIQTVGIKTDHKMVSVRLTTANAPTTGPGRWVMPKYIMKDRELSAFVQERGITLQRRLENMSHLTVRDPDYNPQTLWADFKRELILRARTRAKKVIPRVKKEIDAVALQLEAVLGDPDLSEDEKELTAAVLTEKLAGMHIAKHNTAKIDSQIRNKLEGEVIGKYWSAINKAKAPREVIHRLEKPQRHQTPNATTKYETDSRKMANIARNYHNSIQEDRQEILPTNREPVIVKVLGRTARKATPEQAEQLKQRLTREDIIESLKKSANDKAPGENGVTYEVWKIIDSRYHTFTQQGKEAFDIVGTLQIVYNDVEVNGVVAGTGFAKSWMAPIYKKNNRADIANYRPISLLNTDYKIFSKALAIKLARVAPDLIHPAQAGFVPGRHIYDQIWLTKRVLDLGEATEVRGVIVALDQEKAYDKIEHDYLWRALASFNIPKEFIDTVKTLYSDAYTTVAINGVFSDKPFKVTRGVRQGDPLSCLLFDLAIEPLAESLRCSDIKGVDIKGSDERLVATLFADDTLTYLSHEDDFGTLVEVLDEWCIASGAKFNIDKTEIIPFGKEGYRMTVLTTRLISGVDGTRIPDHIKIAKDGEPVRTLGAWVGNKIEQAGTWTRTLEKMDAALAQWELGHPSMEGRRLIILMVVGGMTQYLAKVQGMPKDVEAKLERRIRSFLWGEKKNTEHK